MADKPAKRPPAYERENKKYRTDITKALQLRAMAVRWRNIHPRATARVPKWVQAAEGWRDGEPPPAYEHWARAFQWAYGSYEATDGKPR